jgi:uncharacterized membrane protein
VPQAGEASRLGQLLVSQGANLLAILGALLLVLRKRTSPLLRQLGVLALATLVALAVIRLSGTAANSYNQERAFVQMLALLGVATAWMLQGLAGRVPRLGGVVAAGVAVALGVVFFNTSGLRQAALGTDRPANLADRGEDVERFVVSSSELASASWLGQAAPKRDVVYADRYGQLRYLAATGRTNGLLLHVTPRTLDRRGWIYASRTNVVDGRVRGQVGSDFALYRWPRFVEDHWNVVYSNRTSKVYDRP